MSSSLRGFSKLNNLRENTNDRLAITNLISELDGISNDVDLFANNLKNSSQILVYQSEYQNGVVTIVNTTLEEIRNRASVFTDGDKVDIFDINNVKINVNPLYIRDSDSFTTFSFSENESLSGRYAFTPSTDFYVVRKNTVTLENLQFIGSSDPFFTNTGVPDQSDGGDTELVSSIPDTLNSVQSSLSLAKFAKESKLIKNDNNITNLSVTTEGHVIAAGIVKGQDINKAGIYIVNPVSTVNNIQKLRTFSSDINPWADNGSDLETNSSEITTGTLKLSQGIQIDFNNPSVVQTIPPGDLITDFTYKVKVIIDDVEYFLCLGV